MLVATIHANTLNYCDLKRSLSTELKTMGLLSEDTHSHANSEDSEEDSYSEIDSQQVFVTQDDTPPPYFSPPILPHGRTEQFVPVATLPHQDTSSNNEANNLQNVHQISQTSQLLAPNSPNLLPSFNPSGCELHSPLSDELNVNVALEPNVARGKLLTYIQVVIEYDSPMQKEKMTRYQKLSIISRKQMC